jgi:hypothetical protein
MKCIFLLQMEVDTTLEEQPSEETCISLNVITGISSAKTMKLSVHIRDALLHALVDLGSTHSFISELTAT